METELIPAVATGADTILNHGLMGLAFLMAAAGLVALLFEIRQTDRSPHKGVLAVIAFFLLVTLALLGTVGAFEYNRKQVQVYVHVESLPYGTPESLAIKVGAIRKFFSRDGMAAITIKDEDSLILVLESLVKELEGVLLAEKKVLEDKLEAA